MRTGKFSDQLTRSDKIYTSSLLFLIINYFIRPGVIEVCHWFLLCLGDVDVTFLTDSDRILVTAVSEDGSLGTAVVTDRLATPPAVVLPQSHLFLVVHRSQVPEERPAAELTGVRGGPVRGLYPGGGHVPAHQPGVLSSTHQAAVLGAVHQAAHLGNHY